MPKEQASALKNSYFVKAMAILINTLDSLSPCMINSRSLEIKQIQRKERTPMFMIKFYVVPSFISKAGVDSRSAPVRR